MGSLSKSQTKARGGHWMESLEDRRLLSIAAPGGLDVKQEDAAGNKDVNSLLLTWTDNSNNETAFRIERSRDNGGNFAEIAVVGECHHLRRHPAAGGS